MSTSAELAPLRRKNLLNWMDSNKASRTALASRLGVGRAYISLLFKPEKFFGEKAARSIETKLLLPAGYLDAEQGELQVAVEQWTTLADLPQGTYALVPRVPVEFPGDSHDVQKKLPPLAFRKEWLESRGVTERNNLRVLEINDDSMSPYIQAGDIVLIDVGQQEIKEMQIYAINYAGEARVRRLARRFDGGLMLRSDHSKYPEESLSSEQASQIAVLGRFLYRAG